MCNKCSKIIRTILGKTYKLSQIEFIHKTQAGNDAVSCYFVSKIDQLHGLVD